MKDMKNSLRPKKGTKKGYQKTRLLYRKLREEGAIPKATYHSNEQGRRSYGINVELNLPSCRILEMFLSFFKNDHFFSAFFEVEERELQAKTS